VTHVVHILSYLSVDR